MERGATHERMRQGETVLVVGHAESGICLETLYQWKHQALMDAGVFVATTP